MRIIFDFSAVSADHFCRTIHHDLRIMTNDPSQSAGGTLNPDRFITLVHIVVEPRPQSAQEIATLEAIARAQATSTPDPQP